MRFIIILTALVLLSSAVCGQINYPDFTSVDGLLLLGSAERQDNQIQMTRAIPYQRAAIWYAEKQHIQDGFYTTFQFQIEKVAKVSADAVVFVIQNDQIDALGASGGHLGYGYSAGWEDEHEGEDRAISNCVAIEFDTYQNEEFGDPNANHISIHTNGEQANSQLHLYSIGLVTDTEELANGEIHTVSVHYIPGELKVFFGSGETPVMVVPIDLSEALRLDSGRAWLGFTAATGGAVQHNRLISWTSTSVENRAEYDKPYVLLDSVSPYVLKNLQIQTAILAGYESGWIPDLVAIPTLGIGLFNWVQLSASAVLAGFPAQTESRFAGFEVTVKSRIFLWGEESGVFGYLKYHHALGEPIILTYEGEIPEVGAVISPRADIGIDVMGGFTGRILTGRFGILFDLNYSCTERRLYFEPFSESGYKNRLFINLVPSIYLDVLGEHSLMIGVQNRVTYWFKRGFMYDLLPQVTWKPFRYLVLTMGVGFPILGGNVYKLFVDIKGEFP